MPGIKNIKEAMIKRFKNSDEFEEDSLQSKILSSGITLVFGKLKGSETIEPESIAWSTDKFTKAEAEKWLAENLDSIMKNEKQLKEGKDGLTSVSGVEIFSTGKWNGDTYTEADLDEMVTAFKENKIGFRPPLKLGHSENQKLIQDDGMPAAGWIGNVYKSGNKLLADFIDVPKKIAKLIKTKAYRKVSSEIYWNISIGEKLYKRMLGAVALLGADNPGVMNLNDILGMYSKAHSFDEIKSYAKLENDPTIKICDTFETKIKGDKMPTVEELQAELLKNKEKLAKFSKEATDKEDKIKALEAANKDADEKLAKFAKDSELAEVKSFTASLKAEKLCTPAMEKIVQEMLIEPSEKKYSLGADKTGDKKEAIKELLKLFKAASEVNFEEKSHDSDAALKKKSKEDKMLSEIEKYQVENKCDYTTAYKVVAKKYANDDQSNGDDE